MVIDFHTHTFPDVLASKVIPKLERGAHMHAFLDGTLDGLKKSMERAGVDTSIVLPVATTVSQVSTCNNCAELINKENQNTLISFGAMHPDYEQYKEELYRIKNMGMKGIKLHPDYQQTMIDDIKYKRIIDVASNLGLITIIHAGIDIGLPGPVHAVPSAVKNLIDDVNPSKLVLAHMGGFNLWEHVLELLTGTNVYLDTAFSLGEINYFEEYPVDERKCKMMTEDVFLKMVHAFGEDKILFATDSPWGGQKETLKCFDKMNLTDRQKRKILSGNAMELLGL